MNPTERIRIGLEDSWIAVFLKCLAVLLFLGGASHLASIGGLIGGAWTAKPLHFQIADSILFVFDLTVGWGLWRKKLWAVFAWIAGVLLLQVIPFTLFMDFFATNAAHRQTLWAMLAIHAVTIGVFVLLLLRRKKR